MDMPSLTTIPTRVDRRFPSKIDRWLAVLLLLPLAVAIAAAIGAITGDAPIAAALIILPPQAMILWVLARTFYVVSEDTLVAHCGPFRRTVPLASIRSLAASRSILSAPALSIDRIAVAYSGGTLFVSPLDKAGFVSAILAGVPSAAVTNLPGAQAGDPATEPARALNVSAVVAAVVVLVAAIAFVAFTFHAGTKAPEVSVSSQQIAVGGMYSTTIARSEVVRIALDDTLPATSRRSGFSAGGHLRGDFDVEGMGRARLFVTRDAPPYLVIHTTTRPVIINFEDASRTRALYDQLHATWR